MYRESDIKHETADFWVLAIGAKGFEVYHRGITHSTRVAIVGRGERPGLGLPGAITECDRRQAAVDATKPRGPVKPTYKDLLRARLANELTTKE